MGRLGLVRAFFEPALRYVWIYLAIPTLLLIGHVSSRDFPTAWLATFLMIACIGLPTHLTYLHLFDRVVGGDLVSLRAVPFHLVTVVGWVVVGVRVGGFLASPLLDSESRAELMRMVGGASFFGAPLVVAGIIAYERYQERQHAVRTRELRLQSEALSAQVQALQARIQPHFLFNSLNAVASLIAEDPQRAETALEKLSDLFRYALEASDQQFVPLARELASVEGYLELETLRFPDRLATSVSVETGIGTVPVPPLFLQPLVENAVRHGIAARRDGGRLEVEIRRGAGELRVRVEDDGPGPGASPHRGAGSALADLRTRLNLLYGDRASLGIDRGPLGGYRVMLRLPMAPPGPAEEA